MKRPVTIQARLLALFVVAAAIPLGVVSILSYHNSIEAVERMVGNRTSRLAVSVGDELSRKFAGRLGDRILIVNEPVQRFLRVSEAGDAQARPAAMKDLEIYAGRLFEEYGRYYREMILADAAGNPVYRFGRSKGSSRVATAPPRDVASGAGSSLASPDTLTSYVPEELPLPAHAEQIEAAARDLQAQLREQEQLARESRDGEPAEYPVVPEPPGEPVLPADVLERLREGFSRSTPGAQDRGLIGPEDPRFGLLLPPDRARYTEEENIAAKTGIHLGPNQNMVVLTQAAGGQYEAVRVIRPVFSVNEPDQRLGVLILDLRVDYLFPEDLAAERFGSEGELVVVNQSDGEVLFHSSPELVGQKLRIANPSLAGILEHPGGEHAPPWFEFHDEGGYRIAAQFGVETVGWTVIATAVPREFATEVRAAGIANLVVASAAALLAFGFLLFSSRRISRSVHVVTEGAREIATGNLRHTIRVETRDEIQTLAETFNAMTASLRENIALRESAASELESLNRTLEDRVTERTRELQSLNEALNRANQELKELDRLKSNFLATVSHEFKTPLTSITAFSEILLDEMTERKASPEVIRFLNIVNTESGRLGRLIRNLLDLSRIEAGRMRWEHSVFPIHDVVCASLDGLLPVFSEKDIQVHRDVSCPGARVDADRDRVQQVITNLIENAVKFSDKGSRIWIGCRETRSSLNGGGFLEFTVRDEGPGIPESQLVRIFERFHQVDNSETRGTGGSGLGLAISKEIVEHHGGTIWVESEPGRGAAFRFTIPFLREDEHG